VSAYLTPGVYYERVDASAPVISAVRTDVAGFVGLATRGPLDTPVPLQSWRQFQAHFGNFTGAAFLAYAVRGFFENGGRRCWVVRVASRDEAAGAAAAGADVAGASAAPIWRVAASSPGVWGNALSFTLKATHRAQTLAVPGAGAPEATAVASTNGFRRGTLVRLAQDGAAEAWKVVSDVDAAESRLVWVHPDPKSRLPYDAPLSGFSAELPVLVESLEYTLVVRESNAPVAIYENLSLVPEAEDYGPRVLAPWAVPSEFELRENLPPPPRPVVIEELRPEGFISFEPLDVSADATVACAGGRDGLAILTAADFVGEEVAPTDDDATRARKRRGMSALELVGEVSVVAVPDIHVRPFDAPPRAPLPPCVPDPCLPVTFTPPAPPRPPDVGELPPVFSESDVFRVQSALVEQCERLRDRIALVDAPAGAALDNELGVGAARVWRSRFDTKYAAFYYPWLRVVDPLRGVGSLTRDVPPTGHVAGQFARTDFEVGVHKAPANAPLRWTQDVTVGVGDAVHGVLNPLGVNVVRALPGRGIRIFGARTLTDDGLWRYVNVRRLLMMIEKAVDISTQWAAFEPNDRVTRNKIQLALSTFLLALWRKGALAGPTPDASFFVKCDEENNPASERANGRLLAVVGVAPAVPFEFVVLRVGRTDNEFEIAETDSTAGGV
jgi:hypothetical protein